MSKPTTLVRMTVNPVVLLICAIALTAPVAAAQTQGTPERRGVSAVPAASSSSTPSPTASTANGNHDLSITANVTARELLFEIVPNPTVEFPGRPRRDTVWEAERTNLPPQVQPGTTYRDIGIRLKITSVFADIERIVAEALGEVPASDDTPQQINSNGNAQPPTNNATATPIDAAQADAVPLPPKTSTQTSRASSARPTPARRALPPRQRRP